MAGWTRLDNGDLRLDRNYQGVWLREVWVRRRDRCLCVKLGISGKLRRHRALLHDFCRNGRGLTLKLRGVS